MIVELTHDQTLSDLHVSNGIMLSEIVFAGGFIGSISLIQRNSQTQIERRRTATA